MARSAKTNAISAALMQLDTVLCDPECECSVCWPTRRAMQSLHLALNESYLTEGK